MAVSYDLEARKQKRIADRLRSLSAQLGQGAFDTKPVQMVSGIAVAPSSWELLSQGLRGVASHSMARDADEAEDRLATALYKQKMKQYGLGEKPSETAAEGGSAVAGENTGGGFIDRLPVGVRQDLMLNEGNPAVQREIMRDYARTNEQKNAAASGFQNPFEEYTKREEFVNKFKKEDREDRQKYGERRFNAEWGNKKAQQDDAQDFTAEQAGDELVNQTVTNADGSKNTRQVPKSAIIGGFSRDNPVAFEQPENMTPEEELTATNNADYSRQPNNLLGVPIDETGAVVGDVTPSPAKSRAAAADLRVLEKRATEQREAADLALSGKIKNDEMREIVKGGDYYSGMGAGVKKFLGRGVAAVENLTGIDLPGVTKETVSNTETMEKLNAENVLKKVQELGAGTAISNSDLIFAKGMSEGNIEDTPETQKRLLEINRRADAERINRYNRTAGTLQEKGVTAFDTLENPYESQSSSTSAPKLKRRMIFNPETGDFE